MKIKNKKANLGFNILITGIVALVILFSVWYFLFGSGRDLVRNADIILPGLNITPQTKQPIKYIGYNIVQDAPKYFDGTRWYEFDQNLKISDKELSPSDTRFYFANHIYKDFPSELEIQGNKINSVLKRAYRKNFYIEDVGGNADGKIMIRAHYVDLEKGGEVQTYFLLNFDNTLSEQKPQDKTNVMQIVVAREGNIFSKYNGIEKEKISAAVKKEIDGINRISYPIEYIRVETPQRNFPMETALSIVYGSDILLQKDYILKSQASSDYKKAIYRFYNKEKPLDLYLEIEFSGNIWKTNVWTWKIPTEWVWFTTSEPEQEIIRKTSAWQNSILSKPMPIKFKNDPLFTYFCAKKIEVSQNPLLYIDISQKTSEDATCQ